MSSGDKTSNARTLAHGLTAAEWEALQNIAGGGSVRDLAKRLSAEISDAAEIVNSMKLKLGAERDADAVRVALYAGVCDRRRARGNAID